MNRFTRFAAATALAGTAAFATQSALAASPECPSHLDQTFRKLHSKDTINLCEAFAGKPMLIVNTASRCGFTPQFEGLEALHKEYADKGLVIVGFPSNDFRQEAKDEETTAEVCYQNYGVTFTMVEPVSVKGEQAHPLFRELARQADEPSWNFNKYVVDKNGNVVTRFGSMTGPTSDKMKRSIEQVL